MNGSAGDRLYNLLPGVYRLRDAAQGEPLRALLSLIEEELSAVERDIEGLYENWFIETCDEWVVPYIGDLLKVRALYPGVAGIFSERAYVAHTLGYRRRKGTAAMLEQLARDVTGWPARVVEFFQLLATTQYLNHIRPANTITPDLRNTDPLELLGGPFEDSSRTADVRHIAVNRGKYNIPNLGIYLWRLQSYAVTQGTARPVIDGTDGRYRFNPLGFDASLFNQPQTLVAITRLASEINVPATLRRRALYDELEGRRQTIVDGHQPGPAYFGVEPVLQIIVAGVSVLPERIMICDLSDLPSPAPPGTWRKPPTIKSYIPSSGGASVNLPIQVSVDPVLGRLAFAANSIPNQPSQVLVSYSYGFSGDLGGGPYDRSDSVSQVLAGTNPWQVAVSKELAPIPNLLFSGLADAVQAWNKQPPGTFGVIAILDSQTYPEKLTGQNQILILEGSQLLIVAADWPLLRLGNSGQKELVPNGVRPQLLGDVSVSGKAVGGSPAPGTLALNGLLIEGAVKVLAGNLGTLRMAHCTLAPEGGGLVVNGSVNTELQNSQLSIFIDRSICGPITLPDTVPGLNLVDSIVDAAGGAAITAPGAEVNIQRSTVLGTGSMRSLEAGNSSFTGQLKVERRQAGCVWFCYVPAGSLTSRRYRCQPDLALSRRAKELGLDSAQQLPQGEKDVILARDRPQFTSIEYGQPGYAQLSPACADEIRTGADDGSEMGAFSFLKQPQREANLRAALEEYLRFGLEAGIFYAT